MKKILAVLSIGILLIVLGLVGMKGSNVLLMRLLLVIGILGAIGVLAILIVKIARRKGTPALKATAPSDCGKKFGVMLSILLSICGGIGIGVFIGFELPVLLGHTISFGAKVFFASVGSFFGIVLALRIVGHDLAPSQRRLVSGGSLFVILFMLLYMAYLHGCGASFNLSMPESWKAPERHTIDVWLVVEKEGRQIAVPVDGAYVTRGQTLKFYLKVYNITDFIQVDYYDPANKKWHFLGFMNPLQKEFVWIVPEDFPGTTLAVSFARNNGTQLGPVEKRNLYVQ